MAFFANRNSKGTILIADGSGGTLKVLAGKAKPATQKAKRDEGSVKKGDDIKGLEFALEIADSENIKGQIFEQGKDGAYGKYIPDLNPIVFPLKCTIFVPGNCGEAYQALFDNAVALGLPEDIMGGFKADLNIGENKFTDALRKGDFKAAPGILGMLFDNWEKVTATVDFAVPFAGSNGGGKAGQSEADKLADRVKFIEALLTDASPEQQLLVKLTTANAVEIPLIEFIALMFA
jgi:hypothetical protein